MVESDFWRDLEARFRRLQPRPPQPGEIAQDSHNGLYAHWNATPSNDHSDQWYLSGGERGVKEFFSWEAESAAVALGHPKGPSSLSFWLDLLKCHTPFYRSFGETGGYLYRVCDASAEYCHKLSSDAAALVLARESVGAPTEVSPEYREGAPGQRQPAAVANGGGAPDQPTAAWGDIEVYFLDPENVQLTVHGEVKRLSYAEMGFADRRGRKVGDRGPTQAWGLLKRLAEQRGTISVDWRQGRKVPQGPRNKERDLTSQYQVLESDRGAAAKARTELQTQIKDLRRRLSAHFGIAAHPIVFEQSRYRALFNVGCSPCFH